MKPAKAGQPYSAAINHVIVGQVLHSPALNEGHVLVNPPYLELLLPRIVYLFASPPRGCARGYLRVLGPGVGYFRRESTTITEVRNNASDAKSKHVALAHLADYAILQSDGRLAQLARAPR